MHLRDFEKKLIYTGWVETFSGTEKLRELRLKGVVVYDFDGEMVSKCPRVYLARKMDISIWRSQARKDGNMTKPEGSSIRPVTEGYVRKYGHNSWPSQLVTRPPPPGPMNRRKAPPTAVDTTPTVDRVAEGSSSRPSSEGSSVRPLTEGYVRKYGHNSWPSQLVTRPPPPGPMNRPKASATPTVETEPKEAPAEAAE